MNHTSRQAIAQWVALAQSGLREIGFVRSRNDIGIIYDKLIFMLSRKTGRYEKVGGIPPCIQIEPTNYCNARCICCSAARSTRKRGFMDFDLFKRIIEDAAQTNIKRVHLYLHGEPMLHPKIIEMIGFIKSRGLAVHLTTNGMLFNRQKILAILDANVNLADHFVFSILGASKEIHEATMKRVDHERVADNISVLLNLRKVRRSNGPIVETKFYSMPTNQHEAGLYLKTYQGHVDHARVIGRISSSFADYNTSRAGQNIKPRTKSCSLLWERLTVFWNGDVSTCPQDMDGQSVIGNLANQTIREVCRNEDLLNLQRIHKQKRFAEIPLCNTCDW